MAGLPKKKEDLKSHFKKCKSATFQVDGCSYTIVASAPDKKAAKDGNGDGDVKFTGPAIPASNARNGELSKQSGNVSILRSSTPRKSALTRSPRIQASVDDAELEQMDLSADLVPAVDTAEACDKAAIRLRSIIRQMQAGTIPLDVLQKNLLFAVQVLDSVYMEETRRLTEDEDDLSEVQPDAVPPEVREWLASTFTRQLGAQRRRTDEKPRFRSVAHAIRAGIFVERIYRRMSSSSMLQFPPEVMAILKSIDDWCFDVFAVHDAANSQPVRYIGYDLLNRYGIIHKFKISPSVLENFLGKVEAGYCDHKNPYHNNIHAADVTQTVHYFLCQTGLMHWLTDLEIFAMLIAALIHDFDHTGTTNNFHINSGSEFALLYNDRAVLENHHISAAFRLMKEDENNIVNNLSREEYKEFRNLVIDMVLATDMSSHFQQIKIMKQSLTLPDFSVDKSKALSLVLHCCDISHPAKIWKLHFRWTELLLEEFFRQGDKEKELGLAYSPLCDRNNTHVPESQIGFIDFIVDPSLLVCNEMLERVMATMQLPKTMDQTIKEESFDGSPTSTTPPVTKPPKPKRSLSSIVPGSTTSSSMESIGSTPGSPVKSDFKKPWVYYLTDNKQHWKERAAKSIDGFAPYPAPENNEEPISTKEE